jgi:hypothetical protein
MPLSQLFIRKWESRRRAGQVTLPVAFLLGLFWTGCATPPTESVLPVEDNSTFAVMQREIFTTSCAVSGCHAGATPSGGMSLEPGRAFSALVGVAPENAVASADGLRRVVPGRPEESFLMTKLVGVLKDGYGARMPLGSSMLDSGRIEFIREWIEAGAPLTGVVADTAFLHSGHGPVGLAPPPLPAEGFQLHLPPFSIRPHSEREVFFATHGPVMPDAYITKLRVKMSDHSHHFTLYSFLAGDLNIPKIDRIRDRGRNMDEFVYNRQFIFGSQEADVTYELPPGVGIPVASHTLFDINMHSVNNGSDTIPGEVYVNVHTTPHVERVAKPLLWSFTNYRLRAHMATTVRDTFPVDRDMDICMLTSHFHRHGLSFRIYHMQDGGAVRQIYLNTQWDHPAIESYAPPLHLKAGEKLTLEATYFNDTDIDIYYGPSAEDEMCAVFGLYVDR